jgi:hypothetical protein
VQVTSTKFYHRLRRWGEDGEQGILWRISKALLVFVNFTRLSEEVQYLRGIMEEKGLILQWKNWIGLLQTMHGTIFIQMWNLLWKHLYSQTISQFLLIKEAAAVFHGGDFFGLRLNRGRKRNVEKSLKKYGE